MTEFIVNVAHALTIIVAWELLKYALRGRP
jgi:hypothetical protein